MAAAIDKMTCIAEDYMQAGCEGGAGICEEIPPGFCVKRPKIDCYYLFWIFVAVSIIGLGVEVFFHFIFYGDFQSRAGLVWGPFSPIYGLGACLATLALYKVWDKNLAIVFAVSAALGCVFEYCASLFMWVCFNTICWDYTGTFGDIGGRTNFAFALLWGVFGLLWVKALFPFIICLIDHIPSRFRVPLTVVLSLFIVADIFFTCAAEFRQAQRVEGVAAHTALERLCDEWFPEDWMKERFENQEFGGRIGAPRDVPVDVRGWDFVS